MVGAGQMSGDRPLTLAPLSRAEAETTARWRYPPELATYDGSPEAVEAMLDPANAYFAIHHDEVYLGYVCVGPDARVPGLEAAPGVDDLGIGLAPEHVGRGMSRRLLPAVIAALDARGALGGHTLRAVILDWNERSLAATRSAGFRGSGEHRAGDRTFLVLTRPR